MDNRYYIYFYYSKKHHKVRGFICFETIVAMPIQDRADIQPIIDRGAGTFIAWLPYAIYPLVALVCLSSYASPATALAAGIVLALLLENPFQRVGRRLSKWLLQASVVLLGFGMNLNVVLRTGATGLLFAATTITGAFALGFALTRWFKIERRIGALITAGTAICGGSAIAAVGSSIDAHEGEMSVALGTVFMLNAVALYLFPPLGHALGMTQVQFGEWAGMAIHDISSVVGAASIYGMPALHTAIAVKLSRALWIVPVAIIASTAHRRSAAGAGGTRVRTPVPWFIALFLLASVARTMLPPVAVLAPTLDTVAERGLTVTLFLIGANLSKATLKTVGWRPLAIGLLLWIVISVASAFAVLHVS